MPIPIRCSCGKAFNLKDEMAGKAVKCPTCQAVIRVPAAGGAKPTSAAGAKPTAAPAKPAAPAAAKPARPGNAQPSATRPATTRPAAARPAAPVAAKGELDDLFREAGFEMKTGKTCPSCFESMPKEAMLCVRCGFHFESGAKVVGHQTELDDEMSGAAALKKAARDLQSAKTMQEKMTSGSGMSWWLLGLIFFIIISVTGVAVVGVNNSRREDDAKLAFNWQATLLALIGGAFTTVGTGAYFTVLFKAFKENVKQGLLSIIPLYLLYFGFSRFRVAGKPLMLAIVMLAAGIGMLVGANALNR